MRTVPIGRRTLFAERRRALLGIAGVAAAVLLVLALDGIFAGATKQLTRYIDTSPASVFVAQRGVKNMHMASSSLASADVVRIRQLPEVAWASPIAYVPDALVGPDGRRIAYVIGYPAGAPGGPAVLVRGAEPGPGEIVIDDRAATTLGVDVGGQIQTAGRTWRVSGVTSGMTVLSNTFAFTRYADLAIASGAPGTAGYVLVGAKDDPAATVGAIRSASGLEAFVREEFSRNEARVVGDMTTDLMKIMTFAAFAIGLAVTSLTLYAATLSRLREIGVMKAIGATGMRLTRDIASQAAWTIGGAVVVAIAAVFGLGWLIERITANVTLLIEPSSIGKAAAGAIVLGLLGAAVPLVKVARVDPATVFRR